MRAPTGPTVNKAGSNRQWAGRRCSPPWWPGRCPARTVQIVTAVAVLASLHPAGAQGCVPALEAPLSTSRESGAAARRWVPGAARGRFAGWS
ncbi:hypothetical protein Apa02nite_001260 [Actinoplanes palleronii]|uniref:Uncharacterized protein n=1 Tax=Actinoplanes palleronii TaxID=113570 RepID=A0ABQ4B036_9ACTN|nr:hypothetical protein Apa02nite_001260 [Actinoplanes palleronii]